LYVGMKPVALTAALRHYGVETRQVWAALTVDGETRNRRGVAREDVAAAVTEREDTDEPRQRPAR
jgi:S-DNA-T family DNA segregation ATPase FtsK/SpoIIIE